MERRVYFSKSARGDLYDGLTAEMLEELKWIAENQETTDRDEPGKEIVSDHFEYHIDEDYDVVITAFRQKEVKQWNVLKTGARDGSVRVMLSDLEHKKSHI